MKSERNALGWHYAGLAFKFFQATEHAIKNLGDKHFLLEVSELCIHAANDPSPVDRDLKAKAKAQAMRCGHSWAMQCTDRLPESMVWAKKSECLGDDIGWDRNTALAKKCIARLDRLAAEHAEDPAEREVAAPSRTLITLLGEEPS